VAEQTQKRNIDFRANRRFLFAVVFALVPACGKQRIDLAPNMEIPREYRETSLRPPPNGEPESTRYKVAYQAFWWNCVFIRADNFSARCPATCSGTPAATAGCVAGADDADDAICKSSNRYGEREVIRYLRSLARRPDSLEKLRAYLPDGPVDDPVSK
jgi:hypothetical protein